MKHLILLIICVSTLVSCNNPLFNNQEPLKPVVIEYTIEDENKTQKALTELRIIEDLDEGIELANIENKPILLCFTGYAVVNGRKIESDFILKNDIVFQSMKDDYINVWLYVDDKRVGKKWSNFQKEKFKSNVQPYFVFLNSNGKQISKGLGYSQAKKNLENELLKNK